MPQAKCLGRWSEIVIAGLGIAAFSEELAYVPEPTLASVVFISPKTMEAYYGICAGGWLLGVLFARAGKAAGVGATAPADPHRIEVDASPSELTLASDDGGNRVLG
jgi:hypothetical protein